MTEVRGLAGDSPFLKLLGDIPVAAVLGHVHTAWQSFSNTYLHAEPPLSTRTEPQLTQGLGAYLKKLQDQGGQPFQGDFYTELTEFDLDIQSGMPKQLSRTDIEWRLYGVANFVIEFKVLDGSVARRKRYLSDGVVRFVSGRYSSSAWIGAMFSFLKGKGSSDPPKLSASMLADIKLKCKALKTLSEILPHVAAFDTEHERLAPHKTPFFLAHLFAEIR